MMKSLKALLIICGAALLPKAAFADDLYSAEVGLDYWWASTKVDEVRHDDDNTPYLTIALETSYPIVPHFKFRYSEVDADFTGLEKYDFTFYYDVLEHDLMALDLGVTASRYKDTRYTVVETSEERDFDGTTWSLYAGGVIKVPDTELSIIGQYDFSDSGNKKTADFIAGLEYSYSFQSIDIGLRTGYRVMDYTFFKEKENEAKVFIDGWFLGVTAKI